MRSSPSRSVWFSILSCLTLVPCLSLAPGIAGSGAASADDASPTPPAPAASSAAALESRIYDVSALVAGVPSFRMERGPFPLPPDQVNDEANPLFGREGEEHAKPFGGVDELIESIRSLEPRAFEAEGVAIKSIGWKRIAIRAPRALQDSALALIADFEHRALTVVTIDVLALKGDASSAVEGGLASAVERGALVPLVGARASGFPSGMVAARQGSDQAYVQDEDVEVAQKAKVPDPIVGIAKEGLAFDADISRATPDHVTLQLRAWWAGVSAPTRVDIQPSGDPVENVETDGRSIGSVLELVPGAWTILSSTGDVAFAVRATVRAHELAVVAPPTLPTFGVVGSPTAAVGPIVHRTVDLADFLAKSVSSRGTTITLVPSNYTPPEPPELREAEPTYPPDEVVDRIREELDRDYWRREGVSIAVSGGRLRIAADEAHVKAVSDLVDGLRAGFGRQTRLRALVVALPIASCPEYLAGLDDGATLLADGGKKLLERNGSRVVERGGARCRSGQRVGTTGGRLRSYVGDFDVEIAEESIIGNPIVHTALDGFSFDVDCRAAAGGAAAAVDLRLDRGTWRSSRQVKTEHGDIECPTLGVSRLRGGTLIPLGQSRIVGATLEAGVVTLTIVAAAAE